MRVYLDYNATAPLRPEARVAVLGALEAFGNPSSVHWEGAEARALIEEARAQVAGLVGVSPEAVVFTSGATEANNALLRSTCRRLPRHGDHVVTCASEHPSVLEVLRDLRDEGLRVTTLPVEADGRVSPERFENALEDSTLLASVMWANNETGVIQPIGDLARIARARGIPFHSDAVQVFGRVPASLAEVGVDYASLSGHKLGGPKGVGALVVSPGSRFVPLVRGGPQERRRRAGTENLPGIVGFGAACEAAASEVEPEGIRLAELRERLQKGILTTIPRVRLNGSERHALPQTLNVSFEGADGETVVTALDLEGVSVATGAACSSGSTEPSHVLQAMGLSPDLASASIRFSLGFATTEADIARALDLLPGIVARARQERAG